MDGHRPQPARAEILRHEVRVAQRTAKTDGWPFTMAAELIQRIGCPALGGKSGFQCIGVEAGLTPWDLLIVHVIRHTEIAEGR